MNKPLLIFVAVLIFATLISAQIAPEVKLKLHSADWTERRQAFEALAGRNGVDADQIRSEETKGALISLLNKENEIIRAAYLDGRGSSGIYGEGYSEYTAWVTETVMRIADREPDRSDVWPGLLHSSYDPESAFARWLAAHGDKTEPFLLATARGRDPYLRPADALIVLAQIVAYERQPSNPHHLSPAEIQKLDATIREGLDNKDEESTVRYQAIKALGLMGTRDDLILLERIATLDPEFVTNGGQSGKELRYPMRELARRALTQLRQRLNAP